MAFSDGDDAAWDGAHSCSRDATGLVDSCFDTGFRDHSSGSSRWDSIGRTCRDPGSLPALKQVSQWRPPLAAPRRREQISFWILRFTCFRWTRCPATGINARKSATVCTALERRHATSNPCRCSSPSCRSWHPRREFPRRPAWLALALPFRQFDRPQHRWRDCLPCPRSIPELPPGQRTIPTSSLFRHCWCHSGKATCSNSRHRSGHSPSCESRRHSQDRSEPR